MNGPFKNTYSGRIFKKKLTMENFLTNERKMIYRMRNNLFKSEKATKKF